MDKISLKNILKEIQTLSENDLRDGYNKWLSNKESTIPPIPSVDEVLINLDYPKPYIVYKVDNNYVYLKQFKYPDYKTKCKIKDLWKNYRPEEYSDKINLLSSYR